MRHLLVTVSLLVVVQMGAHAGEYPGLEACLGVDKDLDRLACFDRVTNPSRLTNNTTRAGDRVELNQGLPASQEESFEEISGSVDEFQQLGVEQLPGRKVDDARTSTMVTKVVKGNLGHLYFHMQEGSVWRQNEARYVPYPTDLPFAVEIAKGLLGEYQLRIDGKGRRIRVRRVE